MTILIATMMALEDPHMTEKCEQNDFIIADRGTMDASAFISRESWEKISLEDIDICDHIV